MNANTVIAVCATVIAVASLAVSVYEARAARTHSRRSVQPLLGLTTTFPVGGIAGLRLTNSGLGPAKITGTKITLDCRPSGDLTQASIDKLRDGLSVRPHATTLSGQPFLETDYEEFLLSVDPYDRSQHREFRDLVERRLGIEIQYASLYDERFTAVWHWGGPDDQALSAWE